MTFDELMGIVIPAAKIVFNLKTISVDHMHRFETFVNFHEYGDFNTDRHYPMSEEYKKICQALIGPYGQTILKAYIIQHGREP